MAPAWKAETTTPRPALPVPKASFKNKGTAVMEAPAFTITPKPVTAISPTRSTPVRLRRISIRAERT